MDRESITGCLKRLRRGTLECEDAYHRLIEADHGIVPNLMAAFQIEAVQKSAHS